MRRSDISLPFGYPIGLAYRRKPLVKVSLIIVNGGAHASGTEQREKPPRRPAGGAAGGGQTPDPGAVALPGARADAGRWEAPAVRSQRPRSVEEDNRTLHRPGLGDGLVAHPDQAGLAGLPAHGGRLSGAGRSGAVARAVAGRWSPAVVSINHAAAAGCEPVTRR